MPSALKQLTPPRLEHYLEKYLRNDFDEKFNLESVSEFTGRVLNAVREVEWGHQITYKELARKAGCPGAVRAVANALGRNPYPFVIPCHRVIRSDGRIGGYAWGKELKEALIDYEKHNPQPINQTL